MSAQLVPGWLPGQEKDRMFAYKLSESGQKAFAGNGMHLGLMGLWQMVVLSTLVRRCAPAAPGSE